MRRLFRSALFTLVMLPFLALAQTRRFGDETSTLHAARQRTYDVKNYVLKIALDHPAKKISGEDVITLSPLKDGLTLVVLDSAELQISQIKVDGRNAEFSVAGPKLVVELGRSYQAAETITLDLFYEGHPRKGLYFVGGDPAYPNTPLQIWSQGEDEDSRYWFPSYDFPNDKATSETYVTVKKPFSVVSNGQLIDVQDGGATRTFHWKMDIPHSTYLTSIAVGDFERYTDAAGNVVVEYDVPRGTGRETTYRSFGHTPAILQFFSQKIAIPYPYTRYAQVAAADFLFGGMENITATTQSAQTLHDERADQDYQSDGLVAHELSHQWWGDLVTCADWSHVWLNEGFATYFEALYTRKSKGEDEFRYEMYENARAYFDEDATSYRRPIVSSLYTDPVDLFDSHVYEKGSLVLGMIHYILGEEDFFKALNYYGKKFARQNATTDDFRRSIDEATGKDLERFFDQWLYHGGYPEYEVAWDWDNGAARVTVRQKQKIDDLTPLFDLPVVLDFTLPNKRVQTFTVRIDKAEQTVSFPLPLRPLMVRFDPGNNILKKLDFKKDKEELLFQAANDPDIIGRIRAIDALAAFSTDSRVTGALVNIVNGRAFAGVRMAAAAALGKVKGEQALNALIVAASDKDSRVRGFAVASLGEFQRNAAAIAAIVNAFQKDSSYKVEAEAATALAKVKSENAFDLLSAGLARESHADVVRKSVLGALVEVGPPDKVRPIILEWTAYGKNAGARSRAVSLLSFLADGDREHIVQRLLELLKDPWIYVRESAIEALGSLRAEESLAALGTSAKTEFDGRLRKAARDAITRIRSREERGGGPKP